MSDLLDQLLAREHRPQEASGRVHEFRRVGDELQQLGANGRWEKYIPFRELREFLGQQVGLSERARAGNRRRWERWYAANKDHQHDYRRRWAAEHPDREREYVRRKTAARRADPERWAVYQARQERHREKKRARARQRYLERKGGNVDGHTAVQRQQPPGRDLQAADGQGHAAADQGDGRGREEGHAG